MKPSFARVEIALGNRRDILRATAELRRLADELDMVAGVQRNDDDAVVIAHHKIKAVSQKLRGNNAH